MQLKKRKPKSSNHSRFAYGGLDRVIHERARLSVLTSLITHPKGLAFSELKEFCALTAVHGANAIEHELDPQSKASPPLSVDANYLGELGLGERYAEWRDLCGEKKL